VREGVARDAVRVQETTLLDLVRTARSTVFGRTHGFDDVRSVADAWASALESRHPSWCCVDAGPIEVPLPEGFLRAAS